MFSTWMGVALIRGVARTFCKSSMAFGCLSTDPFNGYSMIFSPFTSDKLAVVGGLNYGLAGPGGLLIYNHSGPPHGGFKETKRYNWKDVLFDVTWSELHEPILITGSGDGGVVIFDQSKQQVTPVTVLEGHRAEVCSVEWSISRKDQLVLSSSWDTTVRIWDCLNGVCVSVWDGHKDKVYRAQWSPRLPNIFASVSGDGTMRIWDILSPNKMCGCVTMGGVELLSCTWNKYSDHILASAGTDNLIRTWDIRQLAHPLAILSGHTQSIRCVSFDPHSPHILASSGYDSTIRFWDIESPVKPHLQTISHHKEFTFCVDFSCHDKGLVADCSWDKSVKVYTPSCLNTATPTLLPFTPPVLP